MDRRDYHAGRWHLIARRWPSRHGLRWALDLWANPERGNYWTLDLCAGTRMWTLRRTT